MHHELVSVGFYLCVCMYICALIPNDPNNLEKIKYEKSAVSYIKTGLFQTTNLTQNKLRYPKSN